ncbi:hypothetical protein M8J77_009486 [Diaphorina citri]|nr:hypothetical protein M8J77_009486 [Diaphorina citri]
MVSTRFPLFCLILGIVAISADPYTDWLNAVTEKVRNLGPVPENTICTDPALCSKNNDLHADRVCGLLASPGILAQCQFCYQFCFLTNTMQDASKILIGKNINLTRNIGPNSYKLHATLPNGFQIWNP